MSAHLEAQIRSLRSELARTRRLHGLTVLATLCLALVAAGRSPGVVRAQRIEVVDAEGNVRGAFEALNGGAHLELTGDDAQLVRLLALDGRSGITLHSDGAVRPARIGLWTDSDEARVHVGDPFGTPRVALGTAGDAQWMRVVDASGTVRAEIGGQNDREQSVFVGDPRGGPSLSLSADEHGTAIDLD